MKKNHLMKVQSILVYAVEAVCIALFILYLGFMAQYYILFYDGTPEMFDYYKQLQVFNKEAFNLALIFVGLALALLAFDLHKYRPGLFGLALALGTTVYIALNSLAIINVIPIYKQGYLALDFTTLDEYAPSTFAFDAGLVLHSILLGLLAIFAVVAIVTFIQRLKEGNPLVRRLI